MSTLYLVATPIGNLEDISLRALRILGEVKLIAAEDTRKTRRLLSAYKIRTPVTSYHEHNKKLKLPYLLKRLQQEDIAIVSEAGMPGISDPGYELVRAAIERSIRVIAVPGASVLPVALAVSGLPANEFLSLGFLPRRRGERQRLLDSVSSEPRTIIVFEAPHRIRESFMDIEDILGNRQLAVCRELTKLHEEVFRGTVEQAIAHFVRPKGEFTLVIAGYTTKRGEKESVDFFVKEEFRRLRCEGFTAKEAVARLAKVTRLPKKTLYKAWLESS